MTKKSFLRICSLRFTPVCPRDDRSNWVYLGMGRTCRPWVMFSHVLVVLANPSPCTPTTGPYWTHLHSKLSSGRSAWWENSTLRSSSLYNDLARFEQNAAICWSLWWALGGDVLLHNPSSRILRGLCIFLGYELVQRFRESMVACWVYKMPSSMAPMAAWYHYLEQLCRFTISHFWDPVTLKRRSERTALWISSSPLDSLFAWLCLIMITRWG